MTLNDEVQGISKKVVVAYFKVLKVFVTFATYIVYEV